MSGPEARPPHTWIAACVDMSDATAIGECLVGSDEAEWQKYLTPLGSQNDLQLHDPAVWGTVTAVADELLRHGELKGAVVARLCSAAGAFEADRAIEWRPEGERPTYLPPCEVIRSLTEYLLLGAAPASEAG